MIEKGLSVRQAEGLAVTPANRGESAKPSHDDQQPEASSADLRALEADLSEHLGLRVSISHHGQGGTLTLRYRSLDQLDYLIARLGGPS